MKKILWKDIRKSFTGSWGRFFSILSLMMLGSFALVGLKVTGPDMRTTGEHYFNELNLADLTVISDYGLAADDQRVINQAEDVQDIEYGYLKDVVIKGTKDSFRLFSKPETISHYELVEGKMPSKPNEIAIDAKYEADYPLGDTIAFTEKADITGAKILTRNKFKVVGYVNSSEIVSSVNLGATTAGTGELKGYAVVMPEVFDSDVYMMARLTFKDTEGVDPYSKEYTDLIQTHKDELAKLVKDQPEKRLASIKEEYQEKIDDGEEQLNEAKQKLSDTEKQLTDAQEKIADAKGQVAENQHKLDTEVAAAEAKISDGQTQLATADSALTSAEQQLAAASEQLNSGQATLDEKWQQLRSAKTQLDAAGTTLNESNGQLQQAAQQLAQGRAQLNTGYTEVAANQTKLDAGQAQLDAQAAALNEQIAALAQKQAEYDQGAAQLSQKQQELANAQAEVTSQQQALDSQQAQLNQTKTQQETAIQQLTAQLEALEQALADPGLTEAEQADLTAQLTAKQGELDQANATYDQFMQNTYQPGMAQITADQATIDQTQQQLNQSQAVLQENAAQLAVAKQQLDAGQQKINTATSQLNAAQAEVAAGHAQISAAKQTLAQNEQLLAAKEAENTAGLARYNQGAAAYKQNLNQYYQGLEQWQASAGLLASGRSEYQQNAAKIEQAQTELASKASELATAQNTLATQKAGGEQKLQEAKTEIAKNEKEYQDKNTEFQEKKGAAEKEIAENEEKLNDAKTLLADLKAPVYSVNTRRETPGAEGYKIYDSISNIIDALANIFPIFLYFVAALVTLTTMTRFVDEERTNSGTLKALGYNNQDIIKKFTIYGAVSSLLGSIIGIILGHTLLPLIVYNAYHTGFTVPAIEFHFHWGITVLALLLALVSAVVPAYLVAMRELQNRPADLLLPKPPTAGSKILLERITPLWHRMSFTHKVTARNIFRYKKRMFMTIFGVCGSVALLFTGFGVQHSVSGISERQFDDVIHYDLIVAQTDSIQPDQETEIAELLNADAVKEDAPVHFEEMTKVAGKNQDEQSIKLIVPETSDQFDDYIELADRKSGDGLPLKDSGAILTERMAKQLDAKVGDTITVNDADGKERQVKLTGITEMYMGHFLFMSQAAYQEAFHQEYATNANLVILKDNSEANTKKQAAAFMKLSGVKGVVQNMTLTNQISTVVHSLDKIMKVLIVVAALLAIVILYNLTNINVSERIRELSTIKVLGFYDGEVTMYIYRETLVLSLFGILVGYLVGIMLHGYIIDVVPPDDVMFNPELWANGFIIPAVIITIVTVALGFLVNNRLKNVDMLEALKSVE